VITVRPGDERIPAWSARVRQWRDAADWPRRTGCSWALPTTRVSHLRPAH